MDDDGFGVHQRDWILIFFIALSGRVSYWFVAGTRVVGDATGALDFCNMASLSTLFSFQHTAVYSGFQLPYCGYIYVTNGFVDGWVVLQIVLSAVSCVLLYETGRLLVDRVTGLFAGLSFALTWEVFHWVVRPMSEPVFTIVTVVVLWRLAVYETEPTRRNRALAMGTLLYLAITRPNGLPIVAGYVLWDTVFKSDNLRLNVFPSRKVNVALIAVFGGLALYRLTGVFGLLGSGEGLLKRWQRGLIVTGHVWYDYSTGFIYSSRDPLPGRTATTLSAVGLHHIIIISVLRGLWFFSPILPGWSIPHVALSMVTLFPLIVGGIVGSYVVARRDRTLFKLWVTPIIMIVLTAMITWVAGSRNFLGPAVACFSLLTGYLVSGGVKRLSLRPTVV